MSMWVGEASQGATREARAQQLDVPGTQAQSVQEELKNARTSPRSKYIAHRHARAGPSHVCAEGHTQSPAKGRPHNNERRNSRRNAPNAVRGHNAHIVSLHIEHVHNSDRNTSGSHNFTNDEHTERTPTVKTQ